jgi:DNA-binding MarR family transcriptional regulator
MAPRSTPEDTRRILRDLSALLRQLTRITGGAEEGPPMTNTQRIALYTLYLEGPLRLNDLAERIGSSAPTASRAVEALVELGLVQRQPDAEDRRAVQVDVTPEGRARADAREALAVAALEPAVGRLPAAERDELVASLERLTDSLSA